MRRTFRAFFPLLGISKIRIIVSYFLLLILIISYLCIIVLNSVNSIESKHEVTILGGLNEFCVKFYGPKGSEYMTHL